jgi:dolichol-phosphate mannosyltransferase/undecaprenyl-phosphate 4-deoxy-4-formamido-L-arabinose transferase
MDDDLQHPPQEMPKLLEALESNPEVDCVFAYFEEKHHALYRNLGSRVIRWINARALGLPKDIRWSSFRAMRRPLVAAVLQLRTVNPVILALVCQSTQQLMSIPARHSERYSGRSNYTLSKQLRLALDNVCNVSLLPLRAVSTAGMALCALTTVLIAVFLYKYLTGLVGVAGWTTIVILISFFAGLTLLSVGIVGEYMVRILREVRGAPRYIERERVGLDEDRAFRPSGKGPL